MSTTFRLTFLYPPLFRPYPTRQFNSTVRKLHAGARARRTSRLQLRCLNAPQVRFIGNCCLRQNGNFGGGAGTGSGFRARRKFSTSERKSERVLKRHGKAVEPFIADGVEVPKAGELEKNAGTGAKETVGEGGGQEGEKENTSEDIAKEPSSSAPLSEEAQAAAKIPGDEGSRTGSVSAPASTSASSSSSEQSAAGKQETQAQSAAATTTTPNPLETVLHMPPPETEEEENASKPPHLQTPPYVHHFDTYTLVQQVGAGGFTNEQAITSMKAVRGLLALNLEVARKGLVSKSDVENETYLFRAACSELKTEIQNTRKKNEETMRRERTLLQHEVDILNQKLSQELLILKDDLKGMFDDRKMSVRMEQRTMESKIQELNYKITVLLNSDSKSEIEGLRWVLTRRSVMGILFMAFMVLTSLRYASYKSHEDELRAKKKEEVMKELKVEMPMGGEMEARGAAEILAAN
ncbi:hypothetical protein IFR04_006366 [Cadophora malorum]|uniref:DUF1640-domain-containing protein n=1 Tax=Cadophora malorum TaxID=108018 RepID=A0A8H7TKE1_9HELO|nr:hypothetical protein IFR04_006366 [Cadophora malorum]